MFPFQNELDHFANIIFSSFSSIFEQSVPVAVNARLEEVLLKQRVQVKSGIKIEYHSIYNRQYTDRLLVKVK